MRTHEILKIDAWMDADGGWTWNDVHVIGSFRTRAKDEKRAFLRALRKMGIAFRKGTIRIEDDYYMYYTIIDRKTEEPLFAAKLIF